MFNYKRKKMMYKVLMSCLSWSMTLKNMYKVVGAALKLTGNQVRVRTSLDVDENIFKENS